jgi:beta-glucosidase-like glycosyl hydrolase
LYNSSYKEKIECRNKVAACAKHFVGDGGTVNGINENNTIINEQGLMNIHMPAYLNAMKMGVSTVMISYSSWNGKKMHENGDLINGYLKGKLNFKVRTICNNHKQFELLTRCWIIVIFRCSFALLHLLVQGFVISDWEGIDRITNPAGSDYSYSVKASINAGLDMVRPTSQLKKPSLTAMLLAEIDDSCHVADHGA